MAVKTNIIDGKTGVPHISSADMGTIHQAVRGSGSFILNFGQNLACTVQDANHIVIGTGAASLQGIDYTVSAPATLSLESGAQSSKRNDIVVAHYQRDTSGVETISLDVITGSPSGGTPADPMVPGGVILDGSADAYMRLWRIPINGITVGTPVRLAEILTSMHDAVNRLYPVGAAIFLHDGLQPSQFGYPGTWTMQTLALQAIGTDKYLNHDGTSNGSRVQLWQTPTAAAQWYPRGIAQGGGRNETALTMWIRTA